MQAGFSCLESGLVRSKNSINVAAKNFTDFLVSSVIFWIFGFALMFGLSANGVFGTSGFFFGETSKPWLMAFFIFQLGFCGTATTIISGAVAERMRRGGEKWKRHLALTRRQPLGLPRIDNRSKTFTPHTAMQSSAQSRIVCNLSPMTPVGAQVLSVGRYGLPHLSYCLLRAVSLDGASMKIRVNRKDTSQS